MLIPPSVVLIAGLIVVACSTNGAPTMPGTVPAAGGQPVRVLLLTATAGFRHDSIATAGQVMGALDTAAADIAITSTETLSSITPASLANYDVLVFALTSGELAFSPEQRSAMAAFVANGGGFIGVHSAADTLYEWPEYGRLVGAYFKEHPWTQTGTVIVEETAHAITRGLSDRFSLREEFYTFRDNPRTRVQVLLRLDPGSVGADGDYPLAWVHSYGRGRAYYNALGHFAETWNDTRFQQQLLAAIRWTSARL